MRRPKPNRSGTVYTRGRKLWISYYEADGTRRFAPTPFLVGQEQLAHSLLKQINGDVKAGKHVADILPGPMSVRLYAQKWAARRVERLAASKGGELHGVVVTAKDDESRLRLHVLSSAAFADLPLVEVRRRHVRELVRDLRASSGLAPRTVRNVYGVLHSMFEDAVDDELVASNPCKLRKGELPKRVDKDPVWRDGAVFSHAEVEQIISDPRIPADRRVVYALLFLCGLRFGESAALRWEHYDPAAAPLGKLLVAVSYNTKLKREKALKTEVPRRVPVHPALAALLTEWKTGGWADLMERPAQPGDLIAPSRLGNNRSVNHALKKFHQDLNRIGVRVRRQHDLRRTFISLAQEDGASRDILKAVTHGPSAAIMDLYTTLSWPTLCAEVAKLRIALPGRPAVTRRTTRRPPSGAATFSCH